MQTLIFLHPDYPGLEFWVITKLDGKIEVEVHSTK
jgi:hypothetical protein